MEERPILGVYPKGCLWSGAAVVAYVLIFGSWAWTTFEESRRARLIHLVERTERFASYEKLWHVSDDTQSRTRSASQNGLLIKTVETPKGYRVPEGFLRNMRETESLLTAEKPGTPLTFRLRLESEFGRPDIYALNSPSRVYLAESGAADRLKEQHEVNAFMILFLGGLVLFLAIGAILISYMAPLPFERRATSASDARQAKYATIGFGAFAVIIGVLMPGKDPKTPFERRAGAFAYARDGYTGAPYSAKSNPECGIDFGLTGVRESFHFHCHVLDQYPAAAEVLRAARGEPAEVWAWPEPDHGSFDAYGLTVGTTTFLTPDQGRAFLVSHSGGKKVIGYLLAFGGILMVIFALRR